MMLRRFAVASAVFTFTACAPVQKQGTGGDAAAAGAPAAAQDTHRVSNQVAFDVASCPQTVTLPESVTPNALVGALKAARPAVMECLVAPTSRGPAKATNVVVKSSVSDQGGKHTVAGDNLSPEGQACIQKTLETMIPLKALPKGTAPALGEAEFAHEQGRSHGVTMGESVGSDYSGAVRLGQAQWCDCYAPFATTVPPSLRASVKLAKGQPAPANIAFDPAGSPEGEALAACLKGKMAALPLGNVTENMQFSRTFLHYNSRATEAVASMAPEARFNQLELARNYRTGEAQAALGAHEGATDALDSAIVKSQKAKGKMAGELAAKCAQLMEAGNRWVAATEAQMKAEQGVLASAQELKAKNPALGQLETQLQQLIATTQEDLTNAQARIKADQETCSKVGK
ncbi:MAG TPA: hypothetical protein VF815_18905 [Myxococcaceae bacterium]|jgi:hypothetical protein